MSELRKIAVSVIIPIYNSGKYIEEAIRSVLDQTLEDIELILVNDGSTDESADICLDFFNKNENVIFLDQKNSGVSIARNNGLQKAKGEYVYFMDSDDTIDKNFLKSSFEIAKIENSDIVVLGDFFCKRISRVLVLPTCAQIIRLDFLNQCPEIRFPKNIQPCEDGLFSHQLLTLTKKVSLNPSAIYNYRQHEEQNHVRINRDSWKVLNQIPTWFDILENFYSQYDLYKTNAYQLGLFMEHEPFEFRYLEMNLDDEQKKKLFDLIHDFMKKNVFPYLKEKDKRKLSLNFIYFLKSENHLQFDKFYKRHCKFVETKRKIVMGLIGLFPGRKNKEKLIKWFC